MNRNGIAARLDRFCGTALALAAGLHAILFVLFIATVQSASGAYAGPACAGANLVEQLSRDDPAKLAIIEAEAANVENGEGLLWKISRSGVPPSFLLGTMHSPDPRIARLDGETAKAFAAASTVLVESTDALDQAKMMAAMVELRDLAFLGGGSTIDQLVGPQDALLLQNAVAARALSWNMARLMQPWMIAAAIAIPVCDTQARQAGAPGLDNLIALEAQKSAKTLIGLETVEEQFRAVAAIPAEFHLNALKETLHLESLSDSVMETTKALYLEGRTGMILPLLRAFSPTTYDGEDYAKFQELLLTGRNRVMAERANRHFASGNAFMAVGALHLAGPDGLVNLIRGQGFTVERAK